MKELSILTTYILRAYALPVIIVIGTILNMLSLFVMRRLHSATSFYMLILALADTGIDYFLIFSHFFKLIYFRYFVKWRSKYMAYNILRLDTHQNIKSYL
jgi:hypothetical protein